MYKSVLIRTKDGKFIEVTDASLPVDERADYVILTCDLERLREFVKDKELPIDQQTARILIAEKILLPCSKMAT